MADSASVVEQSQSPTQIDSRRAQQLMERAMALAERGDVPAAVLASRQAIALNPTAPQVYSMLGLLLERSGDNQGAITAYEKVLQMDPGSVLERESLSRLRAGAAQRRSTRDLFSFDEGELFDERLDDLPTLSGPPTGDVPLLEYSAGSEADTDAAVMRAAEEHLVTPSEFLLAPSPDDNAAQPAVVAAPPPSTPAATSAPALPRIPTLPVPARMPTTPGYLGTVITPGLQPQTLWQKLAARPSFYFRGAPLAATSLVSLMFLLWAHNYAASRDAVANPSGGAATTVVADDEDESTPDFTENPEVETATANPGPAVNPGVATPGAASSPGTRTTAAAPANPAAIAPVNPTTPNNATSTTTDGNGAAGANATTFAAAPATGAGDGGAASTAGAPLNPGGAANREFVPVASTGTRVAPPPRAESRAARDERAATGGGTSAIAAATRAIESGGNDSALRYQQRAQLYLDSGDSARAINDFQSALSAYNEMISRNDRVPLARAGIQACQRGIQIAQARRT